jgi:hypothetical protein
MALLERTCRVVGVLLLAGAGCAHLIETRAINRFAQNLEQADLDGLKAATSEDFSERALRTAKALEDIKILRLPDGKTTVVEVEEVTPTRKRVTVQVGEAKKEIFYEIVYVSAGKWVVDEVYLKQKKAGVTSFKSVSEQLDLLLTVREFLEGWDHGDREQILAVSAPDFRAALDTLPPTYLAQLTKQVLGEKSPTKSFKPQAQLDEAAAVVRLPRSSGETVVTLELQGDDWRVTDVAVDSKLEDEQIPSVHKLAIAVNGCTDFLDAYARADQRALEPLCDADFYRGSLAVANLKQVLLPAADMANHQLEAKLRGQRADMLLKGEHELIQIDLLRVDAPEPKAPPKFLVREVTIYELESKQEKRLSALFTAQEMLQLFTKALAERDLQHLRHASTQDFANRVWRRLNTATVEGLPLEQFDTPQLEIVNTRFQGALTRVEGRQGGQPITYLLREESGRFYVDDMQWQTAGRPSSVKETLALMVPVQNFAAAVALGRDPQQQAMVLDLMQQTCSTDFNRMVWQQTDYVPNHGLGADSFLAAPLRSIVQSETEVLIQLGDDNFGAKVRLRREHNRELIDDIVLVAGPQPADRIAMKSTFRTLLANGEAQRPGTMVAKTPTPPPRRIMQAVYEEFQDEPVREIMHADDVIDTDPGVTPAGFTTPAGE